MPLRPRRKSNPGSNGDVIEKGIVLAYGTNGSVIGRVTTTGQYHETRNESTITSAIYAALLPRGYPSSIPADYMTFQFYDTLQALCSYVRGQLTAKAVLLAAGVGDAKATALSAASVFVLRDLAGHLSSLLFAGLYSGSFRARAKQWRLFADLTNSLGLLLELSAPTLGKRAVVACIAFGSVLRAVCGAAAGAARVSFSHHFASGFSDPADVAGKEGAQETVATLVGMALGWVANTVTDERPFALWALFISLTFAHIWLNIRAVKAISIRTLDVNRIRSIVEMSERRVLFRDAFIPNPSDVAKKESLLPSLLVNEDAQHWMACRSGNLRISLGADVQWVMSTGVDSDLILNIGSNADYVIVPIMSKPFGTSGGTLALVIRHGAPDEARLAAVWIAANSAASITGGIDAAAAINDAEKQLSSRGGISALSDALTRAGWDLSCGVLGDLGHRVEWVKDK